MIKVSRCTFDNSSMETSFWARCNLCKCWVKRFSARGRCVGANGGKIYILYGVNAGQSQAVKVGSFGVMSQGAGVAAELTKIYYSGTTSQFNRSGFDAFY